MAGGHSLLRDLPAPVVRNSTLTFRGQFNSFFSLVITRGITVRETIYDEMVKWSTNFFNEMIPDYKRLVNFHWLAHREIP